MIPYPGKNCFIEQILCPHQQPPFSPSTVPDLTIRPGIWVSSFCDELKWTYFSVRQDSPPPSITLSLMAIRRVSLTPLGTTMVDGKHLIVLDGPNMSAQLTASSRVAVPPYTIHPLIVCSCFENRQDIKPPRWADVGRFILKVCVVW